jgi:hypothetical protein
MLAACDRPLGADGGCGGKGLQDGPGLPRPRCGGTRRELG